MKVKIVPQTKSCSINSASYPRNNNSSGLHYRNLGKSGLKVPNIGFGTWTTFSNEAGAAEQAESIIVAAYEAGINLFDLSEAHSGEKCEIELGKILKRKGWKRSSYIIVSKIYWHSRIGLSRKHIIESVRTSLNRLQLDYIDVIVIHRVDPMCSMEEVVRAINFIIGRGWAMYWGTSRWSTYEIMEAFTSCRQFNCITPVVEQSEYHMFCRDKSEIYMPELFNKIGVGLLAWSPISIGMIFSQFPYVNRSLMNKRIPLSWSADEAKFGTIEVLSWFKERQSEESEDQLEKLRIIAQIAEKLDCSLVQFCIAWCLKNEAVQCLLVGANNLQQLYHSLHSLKLVPKLSETIMAEVERTLDNTPARSPVISTMAVR